MSAPARATAGVAFRLNPPRPPVTVRQDHLARGARMRAYADLLRRLLAAQPVAGYPAHNIHLALLREAEAWLPYFEDRGPPPVTGGQTIEDLDEILSDFGPFNHWFGEHPNHQGVHGWWPLLDHRPFVGRTARDVAAHIETERRIEALADVEAVLPPEVPGAPALPQPAAPKAETPEQRLERLKRALVPLAAVHYDTTPARLPKEVIDILVDIAELTSSKEAALTAWQEACNLVGSE
jgi:hypothetical protein